MSLGNTSPLSSPANRPGRGVDRDEPRRANPAGAYVTTVGAIIFTIATWLDWVNDGDDNTVSGYETDTTIPLMAYLGLGFAAALLYAAKRATRRQHRGLSLSSMAAGVAATGLALSYLLETPGAAERGGGYDGVSASTSGSSAVLPRCTDPRRVPRPTTSGCSKLA